MFLGGPQVDRAVEGCQQRHIVAVPGAGQRLPGLHALAVLHLQFREDESPGPQGQVQDIRFLPDIYIFLRLARQRYVVSTRCFHLVCSNGKLINGNQRHRFRGACRGVRNCYSDRPRPIPHAAGR
ncbi:MAG: hypothetical protein V5A84_00220 [Planctomycetota bacterium]